MTSPEHVFHRERRAHLDVQPSLLIARVGEAVHHTWRDYHDVARAGDVSAQSDAEAHAAGEHLEALGLDRMDVWDRDRAADTQREVEPQQLPVGAGRGVREREALAGDRVLEGLSGSDHRLPPVVARCHDRESRPRKRERP
jgi:hypothetical protein